MHLRFSNLSSRTFPWVIVILLATFLSFLPCLDNGFVNWDDDVHLLENAAIRSLTLFDIRQIFSQTINLLYVPLTTVSFAAEYHFCGYGPFVYHLDNLLLHLLNTGLIFVIARQLGLSRLAAALAAFVFGVHPLHVESVAWVTERKDVLYAALYLLAVVFYLRYIKEENRGFFWLSWFCGLMSMLAKPMALSLPLVLALCDRHFERKPRRKWLFEKLLFIFYVAPIAWLSYVWHVRVPFTDLGENVLTWLWCFAFYIKKFLFPEPLLAIYELPLPLSLTNGEYVLSAAIFLLAVGSVIVFRKNRLFVLAAGYYVATMFFLWRFDAADTNVVGDRFMYLPMFGLCIIIAIIFEKILLWAQQSRYYLLVTGVGLTIIFSSLMVKTQAQCDVWQDGVSLWEHQLNISPGTASALVYHKLGHAKTKQAKFKEAAVRLKDFYQERTDQVDPKDIKRVKKALMWQERALDIKPDMVSAYVVIGDIYQDIGKPQEAEAAYQKVLVHDPNFFLVYARLGRLYQGYGRFKEALHAYYEALRINSYNPYFVDDIKRACAAIMNEKQK